MTDPGIALGPTTGRPQFVADAVTAGGGRLVDPAQADAIVWTDPRDVAGLDEMLAAAPNARWVQLPWAGVEEFAAAGVFDADTDGQSTERIWTCGKGVYAEPVAEHALALGLACLRDLPERVRVERWGQQSGVTLYDGKVTILGAGGITESLINLLRPLRAEITVVRRAADPMAGADRTVSTDGLHEALAGADLVVVALALTPDTTGIIDAAALDAMAAHAVLVNVARGRHVVTDNLVDALERGAIGGAGLDVTDPEPLPDGHPLWRAPNTVITPHTANTLEMARKPLSARITENVRRFAAGEPLIGPVDPVLGY
jgi:phosphoglycerate dehydrogenase-like enzyme